MDIHHTSTESGSAGLGTPQAGWQVCTVSSPAPPPPPIPKDSWGFKEGEQQWFVLGVLSDSPAHGLFIILTLLNQGQQVRLLHRLADRYALCGTLGVKSGWDVSSPHPTPPLPPERAEVLKKESSNWFVLGVLIDSPAHGHCVILILLNQGQQVWLLHRLGDRYALCPLTPSYPKIELRF